MARNPVPEADLLPAVRLQRVKAEVHRRVVEALDLSRLSRWTDDRLEREVRKLASRYAADAAGLDASSRDRIANEVVAEAFGLGPLQPLFDDPAVSDILVNGPEQVFIEKNGKLRETEVVFADNAHIVQLIQRIAARVGRRVDESSPLVDARLPDGSRVNAILPPLSTTGPTLSIRRFGVRLTADDLLGNQTMPAEVLTFLQAIIESRVSVLISGGTGSGKTTLLNCLSKFIPTEERLITVEDTAELRLQQPHVVSLETRPANMEGAGEIKTRDLVRNALRMRPDRIIVGEVRGGEALDMLQAMNTGHEGSLTTIHANDTRDALTRLEAMVMMAGFELPVPVIRHYISSALTIVVQLARLKGGQRKVVRVSEIVGTQAEGYRVFDIFGYRQTGVKNGEAVGETFTTGYRPRVLEKLQANGLTLDAKLFARKNYAAEPDPIPLTPVGQAPISAMPAMPPMPSVPTVPVTAAVPVAVPVEAAPEVPVAHTPPSNEATLLPAKTEEAAPEPASSVRFSLPPATGPASDPKMISFGDAVLTTRQAVPVPKSAEDLVPPDKLDEPPPTETGVIRFGGTTFKTQ